ncbi:3-isopropylmalate dehydratase small subunit [bacterium]|nr:3-isopropylmalate dehydratase small subunit [bacterium]
MKLKGKAYKFGNDINTDYIISGRYKFKTLDMRELAKHVMEDLDPNFYKKIKKGDFIVAGKNFGCGSSREQAPLAIKYAKISGIIAKSFARIFYRNAINVGLPVMECNTDRIKEGDELEVDLEGGIVYNRSKKKRIKIKSLSRFMIKILKDGGLAAHFKKYGTFKL